MKEEKQTGIIVGKGNKRTVAYHNDLSDVPLKQFNASELDIFMALCHRAKDRGEDTITLTFKQIRELTFYKGKSDKQLVESLWATDDKLSMLNLKYLPDPSRPGSPKRITLFPDYMPSLEDKTVTFHVHKDFVYLLNTLTENFTTFELEQFTYLKSSYSKQCYRQLKRYRYTGWWDVSIDEFRLLLDIPESYKMKQISQRVIKPIMNELPQYFEGLKLDFKYGSGRGKPVERIKFTFKKEEKEENKKRNEAIKNKAKKKKSTEKCPYCNRPIWEIESPVTGWFLGHDDGWKDDAKCKETFESFDEIRKIKREMKEAEDLKNMTEEQKENKRKLAEMTAGMFK
jgi:plasmid replication initiation protein